MNKQEKNLETLKTGTSNHNIESTFHFEECKNSLVFENLKKDDSYIFCSPEK